jgi:hypothetical protein
VQRFEKGLRIGSAFAALDLHEYPARGPVYMATNR